jgi:hypothetical protein
VAPGPAHSHTGQQLYAAQNRPDRWQQPTTRQNLTKPLAPKGASTDGKQKFAWIDLVGPVIWQTLWRSGLAIAFIGVEY